MFKNKSNLIWIAFGGGMLLLILAAIILTSLTPDAPADTADSQTAAGQLLNTPQIDSDNPIQNPTTDPALTKPVASPSPLAVPKTNTITIDGVVVQNFYGSSQSIDSQGTVVIKEDQSFSILYFPEERRFLISITGSPFETYRQQAETLFVATLNVPESSACRLAVEITTPAYANPEEAGQTFGLSFCTN